jgi:hypothetical protein
MKNKTVLFYSILIILIISPIIVFVIRFGKNGFSDSPKDWIDFGIFYFSMIGILVTGVIAYLVNKISLKTAKTTLQFEAYQRLVEILNPLLEDVKKMQKTNLEIDLKIGETVLNLNRFHDHYTFIFPEFDRKELVKLTQTYIEVIGEIRNQNKSDKFSHGNQLGATILHSSFDLMFKLQSVII